jgi:two-component system, chemotaxis family, chemotaxis protein CheY
MPGRVLIVEDDLDVLGFYKDLLTTAGFQVCGAVTTGASAISHYQSGRIFPDVVVLDHRLPDCTGLEVARQIFTLDPEAQIIIASADDSARDRARELGIRRFKRKPFPNALLIQDITAALAERRNHSMSRLANG